MYRAGVNILVVVFSITVTLLALELGFRIFNPQRHRSVRVNVWDRELGLRHIPGAKGCIISPEFDTRISVNSKGLRDREYEYPKSRGTKRILCLGDSFTFGYGVQAEDTYAKVLERLLNAESQGSTTWEVMNAGVCGTGPAHQLAYFETEGHRYNPDIVVSCICAANDLIDDTASGLYSLDDGKLVRHSADMDLLAGLRHIMQRLPGYYLLFGRSHLLTFVKRRIAVFAAARRIKNRAVTAGVAATTNTSFELTEQILLGLRDSCARRSCRLIVTVVPRSDASPQPDWVADLIASIRRQGILYVDLERRFNEEARRGIVNYYPLDGHWNVRGHNLTAQILYDFIVHWQSAGDAQSF
jgi:hypothetical protein